MGQNLLRFIPSEKYWLVKLRSTKIPWGHFPFDFNAGGIFSGKISGGMLHAYTQTNTSGALRTCNVTRSLSFNVVESA